ncbi:unnamed protein product [Caenorhabditis auriculariae]|uniref:G-protein coupled receptors family 1 profile domain-containing protein n=1 Tax=Caenorhabditis auriculariae TaxID=2777116 RepID=A0A8S1HJZ1_9PELO|nr:unnamed protein product [Caenorhabditis auriculariae]
MSFVWPTYVWYAESAVGVPLYIVVLVTLRQYATTSQSYRNTFYVLFFQHGIADLLSMIFYLLISIKYVEPIRTFVFTYQEYYLAAGTYNFIYYTLYIRCCGIVLLTLQRFCTVVFSHTAFNKALQKMAPWKIVVIYWTVPTLLSLVALKDTGMYFDENMSLYTDKAIISRNTLMAVIVVFVTCLICVFSYAVIFIFVRTHMLSSALRRELNLSVQLLGLVFAFLLMFIYYALQYSFSINQNAGPIFTMRSLYPMINGFLSYINPFMIVFLNKEIARGVGRLLLGHNIRMDPKIRGSRKTSTKNERVTPIQ